ncbi:MAG: GDP-mannose 4,6-dehydratase [Spirochaetia bacterium]|nr:GDP-mannose 4,6-dehydratase [Spirochaetia bacterium]
MKRALITGITGQDGSYLSELLLEKGYEVHGIIKRESIEDPDHKLPNIRHLIGKVHLHQGSLTDHLSLYKLFQKIQPDECYHLAASSFVSYSFAHETEILNSHFTGTHHLLATILEVRPSCRFFFAGSSEMFGEPAVSPQNEETPFNPKSIYGISKVASLHLIRNYRQKENMHASVGILYNHESPRRGRQFVTRKITSTVARIKLGLAKELVLGNLDAHRDWGYAPDTVNAMWRMLQEPGPDDYVLATGKLHTVREFVTLAFSAVGLDPRDYLKTDEKFFRASEKNPLCGDSGKAKKKFGWECRKPLREIIREMIDEDLKLAGSGGDSA